MEVADALRREKEKVPDERQQAVWLLREIEVFCAACADLAEALEAADLASAGMIRFRGILRGILDSEAYRQMREQTDRVMKMIRGLRMVIIYEKDRIRVIPGECPDEYEALPEDGKKLFRNPFAADPGISKLESECMDVLRKKNPGFIREILDAAERWNGFGYPVLERFRKEIRFYLSYAGLQREMEAYGCTFTSPETSEDRPMEAKGLYDLALACVLKKKGKRVVVNDCRYEEGERFFVLTGPNQGGKTTFARSLGQLVYLTRIGLDVPAAEANVPFFPDIQTHFSVEESVETGQAEGGTDAAGADDGGAPTGNVRDHQRAVYHRREPRRADHGAEGAGAFHRARLHGDLRDASQGADDGARAGARSAGHAG